MSIEDRGSFQYVHRVLEVLTARLAKSFCASTNDINTPDSTTLAFIDNSSISDELVLRTPGFPRRRSSSSYIGPDPALSRLDPLSSLWRSAELNSNAPYDGSLHCIQIANVCSAYRGLSDKLLTPDPPARWCLPSRIVNAIWFGALH